VGTTGTQVGQAHGHISGNRVAWTIGTYRRRILGTRRTAKRSDRFSASITLCVHENDYYSNGTTLLLLLCQTTKGKNLGTVVFQLLSKHQREKKKINKLTPELFLED
jgi:hypothetical protein